MAKVLIVEDNPRTVEIVALYLRRDSHEVTIADDGRTGLRLAQETSPDLIVLDLMLPGMDGIELCRQVRQESDVPIIMLTARVEEEDRLTGLDMGADDYMTKPFSPRELAARVRAVLRRTARDALESGPAEITYGDVTVRSREKTVLVSGKPVKLTPIEFRMLSLFIRNPGRVFSRDEIIERVFGYDFDGFDRTVDSHVSHLRSKLESQPERPRYIKTVYGMGYRFGDA